MTDLGIKPVSSIAAAFRDKAPRFDEQQAFLKEMQKTQKPDADAGARGQELLQDTRHKMGLVEAAAFDLVVSGLSDRQIEALAREIDRVERIEKDLNAVLRRL